MRINDNREAPVGAVLARYMERGKVYMTPAGANKHPQFHMVVSPGEAKVLNLGTGHSWTAEEDKFFVPVEAKLVVES